MAHAMGPNGAPKKQAGEKCASDPNNIVPTEAPRVNEVDAEATASQAAPPSLEPTLPADLIKRVVAWVQEKLHDVMMKRGAPFSQFLLSQCRPHELFPLEIPDATQAGAAMSS